NISRGEKLPLEQMLLNPTTFQSYLSIFFPLAVQKSLFFDTDISMRNVYIGLAGLCGVMTLIRYQNKKTIISISLPLLFFILLSAGGIFKILFSKIFPFVGYVRMNGEFTYFAVLILILAGAAGFETIIKNAKIKKFPDKLLTVLQWFFAMIFIFTIVYIIISGQSLNFASFSDQIFDFRKAIKYLLDNITFSYLLLLGSLIQLITITGVKKYKTNKAFAASFLIVNLIVHCWLILPYTGLGKRSKKEFDNTVNIFGKGIHAPELKSIINTQYLDSSLLDDVWLISSYSKKIGYITEESYPVQLRNSVTFFSDSLLFKFIINQSYLFLSSDSTINSLTNFDSTNIHVQSFAPGYIKASVTNNSYNYITLLQNDYPYWKVKINGRVINHFTGFKTFITTLLPKGDNIVEFVFDPVPIRVSLWVSISFIIAGCIILTNKNWSNKQLFT
ncbi:MAG: hypothetical protein ABUT20_41395, partial [Bacteroidota bacterium]